MVVLLEWVVKVAAETVHLQAILVLLGLLTGVAVVVEERADQPTAVTAAPASS